MLKRALAGAAVALGLAWVWAHSGPEVRVTLPPGAPARETARLLHEAGVIGSPGVFRALAKATGLHRRLQPGTYRLRRHMGSPIAILRLARGRPEMVKVVIPEGFSIRQIAERLETASVASGQAFEDHARANRLEGYLFPTTYFLSESMDPAVVAHTMHEEFRRVVEPVFQREAANTRLSLHQVVTLASIVEREAVLAREKPLIAAVYLNRLRKRMRLEADPTVQYALGHWKPLARRDLQRPSPYNTYIQFGLPPGPICSPGLASVQAVLQPAQTDALYFVADHTGTGGHTFSATYDAHLHAVSQARRELRRRQAK